MYAQALNMLQHTLGVEGTKTQQRELKAPNYENSFEKNLLYSLNTFFSAS